MNIVLWIVQGLLAFAFLMTGVMKLTRDKDSLKEMGMGFVEDYSQSQVRLIGLAELLGAVGLILPALLGIAPTLSPLAAVGLALVMIGAAYTHLRRSESQMIVVNLLLFALAVFVAVGRFALAPFV